MKVIRTADEMREWSGERHREKESIGFVPTMGYIHEGHTSLVEIALREADRTVVSIFVNPAQFGPGEDYEAYPRDEERDLRICREHGVDAVYMPPVEEMYPEEYATYVEVERLGRYLCGASRPGHFRGVTTVVCKLFNAVRPDIAVFGQKDAQQARIIQRMSEDLQFGTRVILGPIVREPDGLAMSSRNVRLKESHRRQAAAIYRGLGDMLTAFSRGTRDCGELKRIFRRRIEEDAADGVLDYVEIVDWETLTPVTDIRSKSLAAAAVKFGDVRLIDNTILDDD